MAVTDAVPTAVAVNTPAAVTVPFVDVHVTPCAGEFAPVTIAVHVADAPRTTVVGEQVTATLVTVGVKGVVGAGC